MAQPEQASDAVEATASVSTDMQMEDAQMKSSSSLSDPPKTSDPATSLPGSVPVTGSADDDSIEVSSAAYHDQLRNSQDSVATPIAQNTQATPSNEHNGIAVATSEVSTTHSLSTGQLKMETPQSAGPSTRGRGSGRGRPRGRGRGGGSGRGGKRKREGDDGNSSSDSEIYSPMATMTKSGRSIQKPTSYVPPPVAEPSPVHPTKRKRTYRRNPDSAVCKVCLRGTSPASNQIVFCDGCNSPYHQFCHHPPIGQDVITELDKEWFCKGCERERIVPEDQIANYVAAPAGLDVEGRRQYFSGLDKGLLVTLLTKATTEHPDLPLFGPEFGAPPEPTISPQASGRTTDKISLSNPQASLPPAPVAAPSRTYEQDDRDRRDEHIDDSRVDHPPNYPRPGQGLMTRLPPESQDVGWLVDDQNSVGVFSHFHKG